MSDRLCARDREIVRALEPAFSELLAAGELATATDILRARYPRDRTALVLAARGALAAGKHERAQARISEAIALYPTDAVLLEEKAALARESGDLTTAIGALAQCVTLTPDSFSCRAAHTRALADAGRCTEASASAATVAAHPACASCSLPLEITAAPPSSFARDVDRARSLVWGADLEGALAVVSARAAAGDLPRLDLEERGPLRVAILRELGRDAEALAVTEEILAAAPPLEGASDSGWRLPLEADLVVAGKMEPALFTRHVSAWRELARLARGRSLSPLAQWIVGWVAVARTPGEATDAFGEGAPRGVVNDAGAAAGALGLGTDALFLLARGQLAAEKRAPAQEALTAIVARCNAVEAPLAKLHAQLTLADLLAAAGDTKGARAHYQAIVDRFGASASVSSARAKEKLAVLGP